MIFSEIKNGSLIRAELGSESAFSKENIAHSSQLTVSMLKLGNPRQHYSGLRSWSGELHDADPGQERGQEGDTNKYISCDLLANKGVNEILW